MNEFFHKIILKKVLSKYVLCLCFMYVCCWVCTNECLLIDVYVCMCFRVLCLYLYYVLICVCVSFMTRAFICQFYSPIRLFTYSPIHLFAYFRGVLGVLNQKGAQACMAARIGVCCDNAAKNAAGILVDTVLPHLKALCEKGVSTL